MRKLVWVALAAVAAILFFLLIYGSGNSNTEAAKAEPNDVSFGIYSSELADSGEGTAAVLQSFLFSAKGGDVSVFCSQSPIQENVFVLDHPASPGTDPLLAEKIVAALSRCGFSSRRASLSDALSSKNAVIIAPTGAVPEGLAENAQSLLQNNDRVIVLQSLAGREISEDGKMRQANRTVPFEIVELKKGEEGAAADEAALAAMLPKSTDVKRLPVYEGNYTVAVPVGNNSAYCRMAYLSAFSCRHADSGMLLKPSGSLIGPAEMLAGKKSEFEFSLQNSEEVGRSLKFYAVQYLGKTEMKREEMPGGTISEGWASRFPVQFSKGGKYVVRVLDQFGRLHAAAYVHAMGLEASEVTQSGSRYEYSVLFGGEPASGLVSARIDNGEKKDYNAENGTLIIWAAPSAGNHTMHFEYGGLQASHEFFAEGNGLVDTYLKLGVPAAVFLIAVYFLLRAGRRARYTITFPEFAENAPTILTADAHDLEQAWKIADKKLGGFSLALYPREIGSALLETRNGKKETALNEYSVMRALRKLCSEDKFSESEGAFVPTSALSGFSAEELCVLRLIHDCMLERGLKFERKDVVKVRGSDIELALFRGKKRMLRKIGAGRRAVIFESHAAQSEFERSLSEPDEENVKIKLALSNGKILFAAAVKNEIDGLLP